MTKPRKLSERQKRLLALIREHTVDDHCWIPRAYPQHCDLYNESISVGGPGDASALASLERRGLILPVNREGVPPFSYCCSEEGVRVYENVLRPALARRA